MDSMDSMITSAEGNAFPKEGHGNKNFLFILFPCSILWFSSTSGPRIDSYQEIWRWNSRPFSAEIKTVSGRPARKSKMDDGK